MLDSEELGSLLNRGRILQEAIRLFINNPSMLSSQRLIQSIDKLIVDIKPQLLNPCTAEDNSHKLVIANLGRMVKKLNHIKYTIQAN